MIHRHLYKETTGPSKQEVKIYFNQKGVLDQEAEKFFGCYEKKQWKNKNGFFFKNWKNIAYRWIAAVIRDKPGLFNRQIH